MRLGIARASGEGEAKRRWGPFSGGQLTTIICVVVVTTLFPVGAWAALTASNVVITDRGKVNQAIVDAAGNVHTAVTGSVSTRPANSTPWSTVFVDSGFGYQLLFTPPAGKTTLAITSLTESSGDNTNSYKVYVNLFSGTNCNSNVAERFFVVVPVGYTSIHQDFPQPLTLAPGGSNWSVCIDTGGLITVDAVGYYY